MPFGLDLKTALVTAAFLLFALPMLQAMIAKRRRGPGVPA